MAQPGHSDTSPCYVIGPGQTMLTWTVSPTPAQPVISYEYRYAAGTDASAATWLRTTG